MSSVSSSTGQRLIENSRSDLLTSSGVAGLAAGVALVLTALGVYGVIAFMVATRTREIGVRVALGATRARVLRDVLAQALTLVVPGITGGMLLADRVGAPHRSRLVPAGRCRTARLRIRRHDGAARRDTRRCPVRAPRRGSAAHRGDEGRVWAPIDRLAAAACLAVQ